MEIVNSGEEYPQGSPQQKIRDFYQSYEDKEKREQEGINPLKNIWMRWRTQNPFLN